ncbi:uncharacterized protein LOC121386185 [Gigantopelta aegis]|uniref:uncharacterized protein LOC121386185 n=1 Tax=Gigantopelta aegis TaxID=1735272 RepID=UPI001B888B40|nr:uncharacterized protein LOC121386185 [Gigantopelta aegis]
MCLKPLRGYSYAIDSAKGQHNLTITKFNISTDAGTWICRDGMIGNGKLSCNKTVLDGPHNVAFEHISPEYVTEGDGLTVNCTAKCNPSPCSFSWTVRNDTVSSGALLSLTDISSTQNGNVYTCTVNNTATPNSTTIKFTLIVKDRTERMSALSAGALSGIVIAVVLALAVPTVWILCNRKMKKKVEDEQNVLNTHVTKEEQNEANNPALSHT